MRAQHLHISNQDQIDHARKLDYPAPAPEFMTVPFLFRVTDVETAWIEDDVIVIQYPGGQYAIKYEERIWSRLEKHFNKDENE